MNNIIRIVWLTCGVILGVAVMLPFVHRNPPTALTPSSRLQAAVVPMTPPPAQTVAAPPLFSTNNSPALALYASVAACDVADFLAMAKKILALPASPMRQAALDLLMERWTQADFPAALTFANHLAGNDRAQAFKSTLLQLGQTRFDEAVAWIDTNFSGPVRGEAELWLYCGWAQKNPSAALARLLQTPGTANQDIIYSVLSQWAETDIYAAFAWLKDAPRNSRTTDAWQRLMQIYIAQHPEEAMEYVAKNVTDADWKDRYTKAIVEKVAETDPQKALGLAAAIASSADREAAYDAIFSQWSKQNPAGALAAALAESGAANLSGAAKNDLLRTSAFGLLNQDRNQLVAQFNDIPQDIRLEVVGPLMTQWVAENPAAAMNWAEQLAPDSPEYNLALSGAVMAYSHSDPEKAITLADKLSDADMRGDDVYVALQNLYRQNPPRAVTVAADPSLVPAEIASHFNEWINETGKKEYSFYSN